METLEMVVSIALTKSGKVNFNLGTLKNYKIL